MAKDLIEILIERLPDFLIFAASRHNDLPDFNGKIKNIYLDMTSSECFLNLSEELKGMKLDAVVNFAGLAITSPVVNMDEDEFKKQLDVSLLGLLRLLKTVYPLLTLNSKVINISSMASFGIFPYISPYCISKASSDMLLNSFEIETGIKTVSIKPGVVRTKFWEYCVKENENNFKNFDGKYENIGQFLLKNALKNANKGILSGDVAKLVYKVLTSKNPKASYLLGMDARFASFVSRLPKRFLNGIIQRVLDYRVRKTL